MVLLGIDTSVYLSICLYKNNELLEEINEMKPHVASEKCAVYVADVLKKHSIDFIDYIAVNMGPGSYTGLRVSLSFVKGLAFGKATKLIGITSMESLLLNTKNSFAILESKRDEVYISEDGKAIEAILKDQLSNRFPEKMLFVTPNKKDFEDYLPNFLYEEKELTAKKICELAFNKIKQNQFVENTELDVIYVKPFSSKH